MFEQLVVSSIHVQKTHKPWTVITSAIVQGVILGVMILIPLIYTEALPNGLMSTFLVAPAPPAPPHPPAAPTRVERPHILQSHQMQAPIRIPNRVEIFRDEAPDPDMGGEVVGSIGDVFNGKGLGNSGPPLLPKPIAPSRIRVGGNVQSASILRKVDPIYPAIAIAGRVSGTVTLHAIIARDGSIQELTYQSGPALLMKAAMDAVREWRYKPTMLNGEPVEVDTTISVVFTLGGG